MSEAKRRLRAALRAMRRALPAAERARESAAASALCASLVGGREPASYAAMPDELDLGALHRQRWAGGQAVLLPRVVGDGLLAWHRIDGVGQLRPGAFGIPEPDPGLLPPLELPRGALVLVPGIAFTRDGRRLGQGGGFYDRLLATRPDLHPIGVGFACQLVEDLPSEAHDHRLEGLVIAGRLVLAPSLT